MKTAIVVSVSPTSFEALALSSDVDKAFALAAECGFDAVEIAVRDPELVSADELASLAKGKGLGIAAIGTGQAYVEEGLSLTDPDMGVRREAIERIMKQLDLGRALGARVIIGLIRGTVASREQVPDAMELFVESMTEIGGYAKSSGGPDLLVEPINRYETRLINSVGEALAFLKRLEGLPVSILADTFHMNIEDKDPADSIRMANEKLGHVHFADSNRHAPGRGHFDFDAVMDALKQIGYSGFLSAEILPEPDPESAARLTAEFFKKRIGSADD